MNKIQQDYQKRLDQERYTKEKNYIHEHRNDLGRCPYCNGNIKDRKIALYKKLIDTLYQVYCWCGQHKKHEFHTKEIRHLLGKIEYTRFGDLVRFGGIVYKPKVDGKSEKAYFGINMKRAKEFFSGERDIPLQVVMDQISGEIIDEVRGYVSDFPELSVFIKSNGLYDYEAPVQELLFDKKI